MFFSFTCTRGHLYQCPFPFFVLRFTSSRKLGATSPLNAVKEMNPHDAKRINHFPIGYLLSPRYVFFRTSLQTCSP